MNKTPLHVPPELPLEGAARCVRGDHDVPPLRHWKVERDTVVVVLE